MQTDPLQHKKSFSRQMRDAILPAWRLGGLTSFTALALGIVAIILGIFLPSAVTSLANSLSYWLVTLDFLVSLVLVGYYYVQKSSLWSNAPTKAEQWMNAYTLGNMSFAVMYSIGVFLVEHAFTDAYLARVMDYKGTLGFILSLFALIGLLTILFFIGWYLVILFEHRIQQARLAVFVIGAIWTIILFVVPLFFGIGFTKTFLAGDFSNGFIAIEVVLDTIVIFAVGRNILRIS